MRSAPRCFPADAGCIVDNVDTVISIYNAVCESTPLIRKIITVTGDAVKNPQNFQVPLGMCYREILEAAGGFKEEPEKMISGGPMMGQALFSLDIPVMKNSSGTYPAFYQKDQVAANPESPVYPLRTLHRRMSGTYRSADHDGCC